MNAKPGAQPLDPSDPDRTDLPVATRRFRTLRSLRNRNFRLYLTGQLISHVGNWFQLTAEIWLILLLTGSGTAIGIHSVLRFGPLLLFGIPAGLLTDRFNHLRVLFWTQGVTAATAVVLAVVSFSSSPSLLIVYAVVLARGIVFAIDNPLRRTFVRDLASDHDLTNAIGLNSSANTIARSAGPALAGITIATIGVAWCFTINALTFVPVFLTLFMLDRSKLRAAPTVTRARGQLREGFRFAWHTRRIRRTLIMVTILGLYPLNWQVILPIYVTDSFHGEASLYGFLASTAAAGSFIGAAVVARLVTVSGRHFRFIGVLMMGAFVVLATTPVLVGAILGLALMGAAATSFQVVANSRLQLEADDAMIGRILALYSVAFVGTRPLGAFVTGVILDQAGARWAFAVSAVLVAVAVSTVGFGTASRARWSPRARIRVNRQRRHASGASS